jgi:hypothetical protein
VIVINETMAHAFSPKENAIGRAIRLGGADGPRAVVVGVVEDVHHLGLDVPARGQFFRPYMQAGWPVMSIVVRTINAPATFAAPIKKALASVFPDRQSNIETMDNVVQNSTGYALPSRVRSLRSGAYCRAMPESPSSVAAG